jgi:hypothetical protein
VSARGRGPSHDSQRMVHAMAVYGRRAVWARRGRRSGTDGATSRRARSGVLACFRFAEAPFDRFKLKNFELKFKFVKYESCRLDNPLQLS